MPYLLAAIVGVVGLGGLIIDTWSNVVSIGGGVIRWDDNTAYVIGIASASALAGLFCPFALQRHRAIGLILAIGWALGTLYSVGASLDRVGGAKDRAHHVVASTNARIKRLDARIAELRAMREAESKLGGCGKRCMTLQAKLETAERDLDGVGIEQIDDPGGQRIEALTFGAVRAADYRLFHPVVGVVALTALFNGLLLLAGAILAAGSKRAPVVIDAEATEIDPIVQDLRANGSASNRELARRLGWSETKASRRVKLLTEQGSVQAQQVGRSKVIALT